MDQLTHSTPRYLYNYYEAVGINKQAKVDTIEAVYFIYLIKNQIRINNDTGTCIYI